MKVFKFGGASVRNAAAIRRVKQIIDTHRKDQLLVVVSAMGKTTNALEQIVARKFLNKGYDAPFEELKSYHNGIMKELFAPSAPVHNAVDNLFATLVRNLHGKGGHDFVYDQVVSLGEVISSMILAEFLKDEFPVMWIDARKYIVTDSSYREGRINWTQTTNQVISLRALLESQLLLTQGFIGSDPDGNTTTLGREGSDFSAAVFASCLEAESVTIWKDVPGVMNADPKRFSGAIVFEELPFKEAAEMTYYGASVIHPKTIKPLANKNIPLFVKSFDHPEEAGTRIHECVVPHLPPLIIFKENQCLISCRVTDYTFVNEEQLSAIFQSLARHDIRINLMQNSAISFSICVDFREQKVLPLIEDLGAQFEVHYNTGLTLITVKNYDTKAYDEYTARPGIVLEQATRSTLQVLVKDHPPH